MVQKSWLIAFVTTYVTPTLLSFWFLSKCATHFHSSLISSNQSFCLFFLFWQLIVILEWRWRESSSCFPFSRRTSLDVFTRASFLTCKPNARSTTWWRHAPEVCSTSLLVLSPFLPDSTEVGSNFNNRLLIIIRRNRVQTAFGFLTDEHVVFSSN